MGGGGGGGRQKLVEGTKCQVAPRAALFLPASAAAAAAQFGKERYGRGYWASFYFIRVKKKYKMEGYFLILVLPAAAAAPAAAASPRAAAATAPSARASRTRPRWPWPGSSEVKRSCCCWRCRRRCFFSRRRWRWRLSPLRPSQPSPSHQLPRRRARRRCRACCCACCPPPPPRHRLQPILSQLPGSPFQRKARRSKTTETLREGQRRPRPRASRAAGRPAPPTS